MRTPLQITTEKPWRLLIFLALTVLLCNCGISQESARKELAKLGKDFSPASFIECVGNGDKQAVRLFIEAGMDVNAPIAQGGTALAIAAVKGNPELVKMLLDKGANPNAAMTSGTSKGVTPLMAAVAGGHLEVVKLLLAKGAKINSKDDHGLAALDYAKAKNNPDILSTLWEHGAPFVTDATLAKLMEQFRLDLHAKAARGMSAGESPDGCRKFVAEQLLIFQQEQRFTTNQLVEARVCAFRTVSGVVEKSAMEERINAAGAVGSNEKNLATIKSFVEFLKELQSDPSVQGGSLLMAAQMDEAGIVKWLLDQRADVNAKDEQGFTPLMWAALKGHVTTIQVLLGASADVNSKDRTGWTATMWAASQGRTDALKMLLSKRPDLNALNNEGKTAVMIAKVMNQTAAVVLLKDAGAKE
jgi:ankyrin repeat protein